MSGFHSFLKDRLDAGGFSTEDALATFLPLLREVIDAHNANLVAPLEGLDDLQVEGIRIWFEEAKRKEPQSNSGDLRRIEAKHRSAVEVVSESRRTTDVDDGSEKVVNLDIGQRGGPITRGVYLPGYVTWEHEIGHHDPLTDTFSAGMILASLACGLDMTEPGDLEAFVANRNNLFELNSNLHPVLARVIVRMTELDRHQRSQDLFAILQTLENYRDQQVDFEFDLARIAGFKEKDVTTKQQVVLSKLRERLFEISRRNRLLHFRGTMNTVNLTHASIPLSFDVQNIRDDQILTWTESLEKKVIGGKPISLNKHLNFTEALYLPSVLDKIIAEARRDQAEFGFAQLRLVVCFLHWANLKEKPIERFESPLVLLPVKLTKKKGIRDTYHLECLDSEAEVNPVIRHQFQQLYGINLPETIELSETGIDTLFEFLSAKIAESESAVTLSKVDRPRIDLIHDQAKRKLDQYRRRARIAGRGVRSFMDLDYSYDPVNYHPLGIKIFTNKVRPPETHLRAIIEDRPRPRSYMTATEVPVAEKERSFFHVREGGEENPYTWNFDLCSVTLANFKYRKMSLVRDYESLLEEQPTNPAFDATFSLVPRPVTKDLPVAPPLDERFDVVPCDPTQAAAIDEAHRGESYIIQGPPGTGKSQTITNLIADYVARGLRVLFVCEKRAAIDVVYARLRQVGLGDLCSLIHDSQTDKKAFVMDLKKTYEAFMQEGEESSEPPVNNNRAALLEKLQADLEPLEQFDESMQTAHPHTGIELRELLDRCIQLSGKLPELTSTQRERLPDYVTWRQHASSITCYMETLVEIQQDTVLASHPLHVLSPRLSTVEGPLELVTSVTSEAASSLSDLTQQLKESKIAQDCWSTLDRAERLIEYAKTVRPIARARQMSLLDPDNQRAQAFAKSIKQLKRQRTAFNKARDNNVGWRERPAATEVAAALEQAQSFEQKLLPWLSLSWWRLRKVLNERYDFSVHVVRPTWSQILTALKEEYKQRDKLERKRQEIASEIDFDGDVEELASNVQQLNKDAADYPPWLVEVQRHLLSVKDAAEPVQKLVDADSTAGLVRQQLHQIMDGFEEIDLDELNERLDGVASSFDDLPDYLQCLAELSDVPSSISHTLRTLPYTPIQLEAAVADRALEEVYRKDRKLSRFHGLTRNRHARRIERSYDSWLESNAHEIRERVKNRFLEHLHTASLSASQLTAEQKAFKKTYNRGRRELEHEFGKSMRYKSIRDLVAEESGEVVKDLKPVWLMSPLSVSDTLPLDTDQVDVVIFDEASQITLEESVPSLFRATQAIVVGDEMQLPPTDFFSVKRSNEEDELLVEEDGVMVEYDLESNSFLNHAAKNLPSTMLGWHYRSRSESLISFSNWTFYDGRLLTVPEEEFPRENQPPLRAKSAEDAESYADELLHRPISFHFMEHGVYEKRRNRAEAEYIAHLVCRLLKQRTGVSIGVVAFSEAQQAEIDGELQRLAQADAEFRGLLEAELEREEDDQFVGLLVKNLENIQGDERDVIILSVCYGHGPNGKMLMNFGPINRSGGEKRLNVAFSRAKHHMALVTSIHSADITNDYNDGANCLKNYLRYAEAVSIGDAESARRVLRGMSRWQATDEEKEASTENHLADQMASALESQGFTVDRNVGQSHFRCDLAIRREGELSYGLGILLDDVEYYHQSNLIERDVMRPKLLSSFGWKVAIVLAKDWYEDSEGVLQRLSGLIGEAPDDSTGEDSEPE